MAKRQKRVVKDQLGPLMVSGTSVNIIMKNQAVFLGQILSTESGAIRLKNTKGHVLHLLLDQVEEIWQEEKVV